MAKQASFYEPLGVPMSYITKVENALAKRITDGSAEITLKSNGIKLLVFRKLNGDIQIYDTEPNLLAEFDNSGYNKYCSGLAMFNAAIFIIRTSRQ